MNFLGHIYLSGDDDQLIIGNFIADCVKGKKYLDYPEGIQKGILLHRTIDSFTDNNIYIQQIKTLLRPTYKLYSGVVTDLFVDHYLAANWLNFSEKPLKEYSEEVYKIFQLNYEILPAKIQGFLSNLIERNRLLSYSEISGVEEALMIMAYKTSLPGKSAEAIKILRGNYDELKTHSLQFITEVSSFTKTELEKSKAEQIIL
jgi:acyl carrier protein phosphodiesterase